MNEAQKTDAAVGSVLPAEKPALPDLVNEVRQAFHKTGVQALESAMVMIAGRVQEIERRGDAARERLLELIDREAPAEVHERFRQIIEEIDAA